MVWTGRTDEAAALGLLLDRTFADAAAAAERPRLLDREFLIGQFDLWDNHLLPAFAAACAPLWTRRSAARAVWRRLGFVAEADHRDWLAGHLDGLGLDPVALLGPGRQERLPFRSDDGRLLPVYQPLTRESANLIRIDYDFEEGAVAGARMEARGDGRIEGYLKLAGTRRYTDQADPPPVLLFHCPAATAFEFPHGATPTGPPPVFTVTPDEASINSPGVKLAGPDLEWYPDDPLWHESQTARTAKEGVREGAPAFAEVGSPPAGSVDLLSTLQLFVMVQLRMMRHAGKLRRWELGAAASLCGGIGAELFGLGPAFLRERKAARRLRAMLATQDDLARAFLRHVGRRLPLEVPADTVVPPAPVRITVGTAGRLLGELDFAAGRLRFVDVKPGQTVIHLDARRGGRDTIVVIVLTEPLGSAPLGVDPEGLALTRPPTVEATADDIALTIFLPGGDWTVRAAAGSWYVD